jgi:hypothetical protein
MKLKIARIMAKNAARGFHDAYNHRLKALVLEGLSICLVRFVQRESWIL